MCHSLLRIRYKNDKTVQIVECESEAHKESKIREIQSKPEVAKITVYLCQQEVKRVETWERNAYIPPTSTPEGTPG